MSTLAARPLPQAAPQTGAIRSILVPLSGALEDSRCLKAAGALAARAGAHVSALYVLPDPLDQLTTLSGADIPIPETVLAHQARLNDEQKHGVMVEFDCWRREAGLVEGEDAGCASIEIARGPRSSAIAARALLSDMVFCALPGRAHPGRFESIACAVFEAGRPVLAIPMQAQVPVFAAHQVAALAWNGSAQAAHSLTAALPLLADCAELVVLSVGPHASQTAIGPVLLHLRRHGIRASVRALVDEGDTGAVLHRAAHEVGARLLVLGAFGKSVTREVVFGGVTDFMLKNATLPLLMAH